MDRRSFLALTLPAAMGVMPAMAQARQPFTVQAVARFDRPWAIGFLPGGWMLVTEKPGRVFLVSQRGEKVPVANVPRVLASGQNGLLDIAASPDFSRSARVFFTYVEPAQGGRLVLARARLTVSGNRAALADLGAVWRQAPGGGGGQPGGIIAFDPRGRHLFLTVGDRMQPASAQDPDQGRGKILRLNLDGSTPRDNPWARQGGIRGQTWTTGHRNPYGLAFAPDGRLWSHEMGPRGGDELNLIRPGANYGWPVVSNGNHYDGRPIPDHATRPDFAGPSLSWAPVISPAGLVFHQGAMFPGWNGSALIGAMSGQALVRAVVGRDGRAAEAERWNMGARIRDVAVSPEGAVWLIEDGRGGRLLRLTP
ncbi:PQQ-dependent sugar dehydrogenase [Paracoccus sp. MC1854]|uniref:PQQ-dependent sugar dehydrogenase n=1 Tax=Paracoccus sp. MC1854 TaxID=2760306 RepID=UPI00160166E9|nr:PQQ-dependent sugar dehydrogenase [Paracoccus sp. MC1854]MBB1491292.1 PQQ-dependent sugar dehydrogenase [Paracoccus sp. MC1854]